jgi:hypothetical protein
MIVNDTQKGTPFVNYTGTKAAIEALSGIAEGATAYATDTDQPGNYTGAAWKWTAQIPVSSTDVAMPKIGSPTIDNLAEDFTTRGSAGVIDGTLTYIEADTGTFKVKVNAGEGYIRTSNDQQAELKIITWSAVTQIDIPAPAAGYETLRYIGIEYNAGSPQVTVRTTFNWNWHSDFPLGRVSVDALGVMHILNAYAHSEDVSNLTRKWMRLNFPFHREEPPEGSGGIVIGETGTRNLTLSAGYVWHGFNRYYVPARDTSGTDRFDLLYRRAGGGFTGTASNSQWPNTQYDDGSGTLATMTVGRYACLWIYLDLAEDTGGIPGFDVVYGRGQYTTSILAEAEAAPTIPEHLTYHGRLIARLIFKKSDATATLIESTWTTSIGTTPISDHAQLSNLQGGTAGEYYHLTSAQATDLTDAGESALHYHQMGAGNNSYFFGINDATRVYLPTPTGAEYARFFKLVASSDPLSKIQAADWLGTSATYLQAKSLGCSATVITAASGTPFTADMKYCVIKHASTSNGVTNAGVSIVKSVDSSTQLTIEKVSGTDFANSYYFYISHNEWIVPTTGIYLITTKLYLNAPVDLRNYFYSGWSAANGSAPARKFLVALQSAGTSDMAQPVTNMVSLTKDNYFFIAGSTTDTTKGTNMFESLATIDLMLLRQTA